MIEFRVGNIRTFKVLGIIEENERKYISLSDGKKDTYRVNPYDYQLEWEETNLPDELNCYVKSINIWGLPHLIQSRSHVLQDCYTEKNSEYAFKVVGVKEDSNTNATYYDLKDPFGLHHRYYPKQQENPHDIGDIFSLIFEGIEEKERNRAYLKLGAVELSIPVNTNLSLNHQTETVNDPRKESSFGYENDVKEFKSSIAFPAGDVTADIDKQLLIISKTIAGFQNSNGGDLFLGVNDSGEVVGVQHDYPYLNSSNNDDFKYQPNKDGYELKIRNSVKYFLGNTANSNLSLEFQKLDDKEYCIIHIKEVQKPIYLHNIKLYQRAGNMTQLLKGDEITYFIEERFLSRNYSLPQQHPVEEKELEEVHKEDTDLPETETTIKGQYYNSSSVDKKERVAEPETTYGNLEESSTEAAIPVPPNIIETDKIWFHLTFYKDGSWSYQKREVNKPEVEIELPIMDSMKNERMLMVYDNGRVNVVCPYDIIKPRGAKGRRFRTREKIYSNGWNTRAKLMNVFCARNNDLLVFDSIDSNGTKWIKAHNVSAISVHSSMHLEGNVLVNPRLHASLESVSPLPLEYYHLISSLVLKDTQTSGYLGIKRTDKNYQKTFKTLTKLIEGYQKYWKN